MLHLTYAGTDLCSVSKNTLDRNYATDPVMWEKMPGGYDPQRRVNEDWYARRGYKAFRRAVPRYQETGIDGSTLLLNAVVSLARVMWLEREED